MTRPPRPTRRGFSLIEATFSVILVAVMFAAVMTTVGAARVVRYKTDGRSRGSTLAHDLMAEILQTPYEEPDGPGAFGRDPAESGGDRAEFDDIDDYDNWNSSPPELRDGTPLSLPVGWSRAVEVRWIVANNLTLTSGTETDAKRIIVTVKHNNVTMAQITAIRTRAFPELDR
jgi:type II secretory pathway pseudopilin PulG